MTPLWMVRAEGGRLYDGFRHRGVVALGWTRLASIVFEAESRDALVRAYAACEPLRARSAIVSGASQVWRFVHEIEPGHWATTYSPQRRAYLLGRIAGPARHRPDWDAAGMPLVRAVQWRPVEIPRDALHAATRARLGPTQSLFRIAPGAARQLVAIADRIEGGEAVIR